MRNEKRPRMIGKLDAETVKGILECERANSVRCRNRTRISLVLSYLARALDADAFFFLCCCGSASA